MAIQRERRIPGELTLYFGTPEAIPVSAVGQLLTTLGADYQRLSGGGELVLLVAEEGSLKLRIAAIAAVTALSTSADTFNHLYDFSKNVSEVIKHDHDVAALPSGRRQRIGTKSAQAILETAETFNGSLRLHYGNSDGEDLTLELDPSSVRHAREGQRRSSARARTVKSELVRAIPRPALAESALLDDALDKILERRRLSTPAEQARDDDAFALTIGLFVDALRANGSIYAVESVAEKLDARGLHHIAEMVRQNRGSDEVRQTVDQW